MSRYLHRMVVTHGLPLASTGGLAGRPGVAVPGRQGAFVAGDWVGGVGQLADASLASGSAAGGLRPPPPSAPRVVGRTG